MAALPWLREAAARAQAAWREAERVAFLLTAADICEAHQRLDEAFELVSLAVQSHMNTTREAAGLPLLERLDRLARQPRQFPEAAGHRSWYGTALGDWDAAITHGQRALALLGARPGPEDPLHAALSKRLGTALAMAGRFDEALPALQAARPWCEAHAGTNAAAEYLGNLAAVLDNLKLARLYKSQGKRVLLVAAVPRRPAAGDQLASLGQDLGIDVHRFDHVDASRPDVVRICQRGVERAQEQGYDLVVLDTGGRLHVDDELMAELVAVKQAVTPHEVLLVADAMTGQDAVNMAGQFDRQVGLTGVILTKVEGDARGGAVLSIRAVTGKPIKFLGMGEKLDALEPFHPDRMASRILGVGDVLSLIEKAQETFSREEAEAAQNALRQINRNER